MITIETAKRVLEVVDAGLCSGLGRPEPGKMCIEAAVCYALGEPHGDNPSCVSPAVRSFKISLNDAAWSSDLARAAGMRKLAIAQLGSKSAIDEAAFCKELAKLTIQRVLPPVLRAAGLASEAERCELEGSRAAATYAAAADSATYAAAAAAAAAATYAAAAATYAAARAAAAAYAVAAAYAIAAADSSDNLLNISAGCCLDALRAVNAPGIALLKELGLDND